MTGPRTVATIEARMTSSRLPGKVLLPAAGQPLLLTLIHRLQRVPELDTIVLATTGNRDDDPIADLGTAAGISVFRGSEHDVLGRVVGALNASEADVCVEITGDCPLLDPGIAAAAIAEYHSTAGRHSYVSNSDPHRSVPAGLDVQVFAADALRRLDQETQDPADREHVSYGFYRPEAANRWQPRFITHPVCAGAEDLLVTLDYLADYDLIRRAHEALFAQAPYYGARELIAWLHANPALQDACRRARLATVA